MTDNQDFVRIYQLQVEASIEVPIDLNTPPAIRRRPTQIPLIFEVVNPCTSSTLDDFTVQDMTASVLGPVITQDLSSLVPADQISRELGTLDGYTYCGERQFRIVGTQHSAYLDYNESLR